MRDFVSAEGLQKLQELRVRTDAQITGNPSAAPIRLVARTKSEDCGCPEEHWVIDGLEYLIHMEEGDGVGEIFGFYGDWDFEIQVAALSIDDLRAEMFKTHAERAKLEG